MTATALPTTGTPGTGTATRRRAPSESLTGTGTMVRLVLRRNRVRLAVWWVVLVGLFAYVGAYYSDIFDTQAALDDFAALSNTPSIKALTGLAAAPATLGGAVWTKIWMTTALCARLRRRLPRHPQRPGRRGGWAAPSCSARARSACTPGRPRPGS